MRVALITEGTYPFVHGGVSVWCDRLIRGLPDVEFRIYALAATGRARSAWVLPPNVVSAETIGLDPVGGPAFASCPASARSRFLEAFDQFLVETIRADAESAIGFLQALQSLHQAARVLHLDTALRSQEAFDLIRCRWQQRTSPSHSHRLARPSLGDSLEISSSLARYLRPLGVVPDGDLAHNTANGLGSLVALAGRWAQGMPCLLTEHGVYLRERYLEGRNSRRGDRVRPFQLAFFKRLNGAMLQAADLILPVSDFNRRWELHTGADPRRVHTIHNGVDPASFPPQVTEPAVPTVSWVGRVDPLKDVLTLIEAFALVRRAVPAARLRLFGPVPEGDEAYLAACRRAIARHGIETAVSFEGHISRVPVAHEAGHVVVLSSISEGFPFTVIEAMMSGRATVSTDVGGVAEAVGNAGLLVPPRDPERLAASLIRVLTDRELRRRLGRAARERALAMFTLDRMTGRYRAAYRAAMERRPLAPDSLPGGHAQPSFARPVPTGALKRAAGDRP